MFLVAATSTLSQPISEQLAVPGFLVAVATLVAAVVIPIWAERRRDRKVEKLLELALTSVVELTREVERLREAVEGVAEGVESESVRRRGRGRRRRRARRRR